MERRSKLCKLGLSGGWLTISSSVASQELVSFSDINGADTAWVMTSSVLVLLMTLPAYCIVLCRHGSPQKSTQHLGCRPWNSLRGECGVVCLGLFIGLYPR